MTPAVLPRQAPRLRAVCKPDSQLSVVEYLDSGTDESCPFCGRQNLKIWEVLNGRCKDCLVAYGKAAEWPPACRCEGVARCVDGVHIDTEGVVAVKPGARRRRVVEHCPGWLKWWRSVGLRRHLEQQEERAGERGRIDVEGL